VNVGRGWMPQKRIQIAMKATLALSVCALLLAGCFDSNNTRPLEKHTADATAAAKRSAGAIARGVVEGLTRKGPLDINKASEKDLAQLPGVTPGQVQAIIAGRPFHANLRSNSFVLSFREDASFH
jgi:DNA uptake protein ComE-like DNA-binding protein